ncbi:hypothetical protein EDC04DRAFT_2715974 [Pisolithus marmoratus]|nr:hypothetical protein EDC04DRAFT_2715974 [Pisolithus marmoratus]
MYVVLLVSPKARVSCLLWTLKLTPSLHCKRMPLNGKSRNIKLFYWWVWSRVISDFSPLQDKQTPSRWRYFVGSVVTPSLVGNFSDGPVAAQVTLWTSLEKS